MIYLISVIPVVYFFNLNNNLQFILITVFKIIQLVSSLFLKLKHCPAK
jgi:hypothetical protein